MNASSKLFNKMLKHFISSILFPSSDDACSCLITASAVPEICPNLLFDCEMSHDADTQECFISAVFPVNVLYGSGTNYKCIFSGTSLRVCSLHINVLNFQVTLPCNEVLVVHNFSFLKMFPCLEMYYRCTADVLQCRQDVFAWVKFMGLSAELHCRCWK